MKPQEEEIEAYCEFIIIVLTRTRGEWIDNLKWPASEPGALILTARTFQSHRAQLLS